MKMQKEKLKKNGLAGFVFIGLFLFFHPLNFASAGVLRQSTANPRYFTDGNNPAIYLTGSHTWDILACEVTARCYNYNDYLNYMQKYGFNFLRLWISKEIAWRRDSSGKIDHHEPKVYQRTGPGNALDGGLKFDLTKINPVFIQKLKDIIVSAQSKEIYVSLMLFEGWWNADASYRPGAWHGHPFNPANNINTSSATTENIHTLNNTQVVNLQKSYVRAVIDAVNGYDNIMFEIVNEDARGATAWQIEMMNTIRQHEATKPKKHLVWLTTQSWSTNDNWMWNSTADVVSPTGIEYYNSPTEPYIINPPVANGPKAVILDTDHFLGRSTPTDWSRMIWKAFFRGYNPIVMDPYIYHPTWKLEPDLLPAASRTMIYAKKMNMANIVPSNNVNDCSTIYCLRNPGKEYLVYQPNSGSFTANLVAGNYDHEWFNPVTGSISPSGTITVSNGNRNFNPPFSGQAILYLKSKSQLPGDFNGDNKVNTLDYEIMKTEFFKVLPSYKADMNGKDGVNDLDYELFRREFGKKK